MATIILAWEYERDSSHIAYLHRLQKHLIKMGNTVYLIGTCLPMLDNDEPVPFLPVPQVAAPALHKPRVITKMGGFADRLALLGFNDAATLRTLVGAWDNLFDLLKPQLLICSSAPTASLAAYKTIPVIQVSDGLNLPPHHLDDFPRLRPDVPPLISTTELLANVHYVQTKRKKSYVSHLPAILHSEHSFVCHIPELDPYFTFRDKATQYGPFFNLPDIVLGKRDYFFAYLDKNYPDIEEVAISLADMDKTGIFYIPGASPALLTFLATSGMIVHVDLPAFDEILTQCAWVVHHGNIPLAEAALAAGIPQFTLPHHFESDLISHRLMSLSVAFAIYPEFHPIATTAEKIREGCKKSALHEWSSLQAQHIKQKKYAAIEPSILHVCQQLLQ